MELKNENGFSLIETVVAMAVLSIGLLSFIGMFEAGYKALDGGNNRTVASKLARDRMEMLHATPAHTIDPPEEDSSGKMRRNWSSVKSPDDANIWVLTVEVLWKNLQGQTRSVRLKSFRIS